MNFKEYKITERSKNGDKLSKKPKEKWKNKREQQIRVFTNQTQTNMRNELNYKYMSKIQTQ